MALLDRRLKLHELLCEIVGSRHVYFQPPASVRMEYPAIRYSRYNIENIPADNIPYKLDHYYQITVIDADPDSEIVEKVSKLPMCVYDRHYVSDNLNHDVFTLYYH